MLLIKTPGQAVPITPAASAPGQALEPPVMAGGMEQWLASPLPPSLTVSPAAPLSLAVTADMLDLAL